MCAVGFAAEFVCDTHTHTGAHTHTHSSFCLYTCTCVSVWICTVEQTGLQPTNAFGGGIWLGSNQSLTDYLQSHFHSH